VTEFGTQLDGAVPLDETNCAPMKQRIGFPEQLTADLAANPDQSALMIIRYHVQAFDTTFRGDAPRRGRDVFIASQVFEIPVG